MALDQKDIEVIERIIFKSDDDTAVSITRSFERLEERIDSAEDLIYPRLADLEDKVQESGVEIAEQIVETRRQLRKPSADE